MVARLSKSMKRQITDSVLISCECDRVQEQASVPDLGIVPQICITDKASESRSASTFAFVIVEIIVHHICPELLVVAKTLYATSFCHFSLLPMASLTPCAKAVARCQSATAFFQQCRSSAKQCQRSSVTSPPRYQNASYSVFSTSRSSRIQRGSVPASQATSSLQAQPFSSTPTRRATVVKLNPRQDEDGKDMTIEISPRAAKVRDNPSRVVDMG